MIAEAIDNLIAIFNPAAAARRAQARRVYKQIARGYDAAKKDRLTGSWNAQNSSADRELYAANDLIRSRARDLIRNNAYARGALDAIIANVVGCGIAPQPKIDDEATDYAVGEAWNRWCEQADITGRLHFYELQSLALREMVEAGESLVHFAHNSAAMPTETDFGLELIEAERLATDRDSFSPARLPSGNQIRRGVEIDKAGRPVAYWLHPSHPNDVFGGTLESVRVSAADILHLYRQERIGQTRGVSWLAGVVRWLRDLGLYVENELTASAVASCFSVVVKTMDGGESFGGMATPSGDDSSDTDGNRFERIQPGMVAHLMPGEDISTVNPGRPNSASEPWINLMLRSIAVGMGLSYELVSRDYSKTTFSSNRASALEDRRRFRPIQKFMVWHLCQPVYQAWFRANVLAGARGFPSLEQYVQRPEFFLRVSWRTPGWEWVDPLKEVAALDLAIKAGLKSHSQAIAEYGGERDEVYEQIAADKAKAQKLGLVFTGEEPALDKLTAEADAEAATANAGATADA